MNRSLLLRVWIAVLSIWLASVTTANAQPADDDAPPPAEDKAEPAPPVEPAPAYSEQALKSFSRAVLDALPKMVTQFLLPEHYAVLKQACPQEAPNEAVACIVAAPALGDLLGTGVLVSLLSRMDVGLPARLSDEDFATLAKRCEQPADAWGSCLEKTGADLEQCEEPEEAFAKCLLEGDDIVELYQELANAKREIVGKHLYVDIAGFLAILPIELVTEARKGCPAEVTLDCLVKHPALASMAEEYSKLAAETVQQAAASAAAAGNQIDAGTYTETLLTLMFRLPVHTVSSLLSGCVKQHPELNPVKSSADLDKIFECIEEAGSTDPVANPAYIQPAQLRAWLELAREKVVAKIHTQEASAQDTNFRRILIVLAIFAGIGFLGVLLMPLYVGREIDARVPWSASAAAAAVFVFTIAVLGASLLTIRTVQGAVASDSTSPKMRVADAAFSVMSKSDAIEGFSDLSKLRLDFIKTPLRKIISTAQGATPEDQAVFAAYLATHWADLLDEPELQKIAKNVDMLKSHSEAFKSVLGFYTKVDFLMGLLPIVLSLLAVVLYLIPLKDTLLDIALAPVRTARGQPSKKPMTTIARELKSVVPFLLAILVILPVTGMFLALAVEPLVELLIGYSLITVFYLLTEEASPLVMYGCLGATIGLLVMCLTAYILTMSAILGKSRAIFRAIFHLGYRFADFKRFWLWTAAALVVLLVLPYAYAYGVNRLTEVFEPDAEALSTKDMLLVPVTGILLFPIVFWAARGLKALGFIKKYPVPTTPNEPPPSAPPASPQQRTMYGH